MLAQLESEESARRFGWPRRLGGAGPSSRSHRNLVPPEKHTSTATDHHLAMSPLSAHLPSLAGLIKFVAGTLALSLTAGGAALYLGQ